MDDDHWRQKLTPEQYAVIRQKGTEPPFSGALLRNTQTGSYTCAACGNEVFRSEAKFESTLPGLEGWPSFSEVAASDAVQLKPDTSLGMQRTEVICKKCGGHLGHLFDDATSPTNQHYCINSVALNFVPKQPAP